MPPMPEDSLHLSALFGCVVPWHLFRVLAMEMDLDVAVHTGRIDILLIVLEQPFPMVPLLPALIMLSTRLRSQPAFLRTSMQKMVLYGLLSVVRLGATLQEVPMDTLLVLLMLVLAGTLLD